MAIYLGLTFCLDTNLFLALEGLFTFGEAIWSCMLIILVPLSYLSVGVSSNEMATCEMLQVSLILGFLRE